MQQILPKMSSGSIEIPLRDTDEVCKQNNWHLIEKQAELNLLLINLYLFLSCDF